MDNERSTAEKDAHDMRKEEREEDEIKLEATPLTEVEGIKQAALSLQTRIKKGTMSKNVTMAAIQNFRKSIPDLIYLQYFALVEGLRRSTKQLTATPKDVFIAIAADSLQNFLIMVETEFYLTKRKTRFEYDDDLDEQAATTKGEPDAILARDQRARARRTGRTKPEQSEDDEDKDESESDTDDEAEEGYLDDDSENDDYEEPKPKTNVSEDNMERILKVLERSLLRSDDNKKTYTKLNIKPPAMKTYDGAGEQEGLNFLVSMLGVGGDNDKDVLKNVMNYAEIGLTGAAKSWWSAIKKTKSLKSFSIAYLERFTGRDLNEHVKRFCANKREQVETHHEFLNRLELLKEALNICTCENADIITEQDVVETFASGLNGSYQSLEAMLISSTAQTIKSLRNIVSKWDKTIGNQKKKGRMMLQVESQPESEEEEDTSTTEEEVVPAWAQQIMAIQTQVMKAVETVSGTETGQRQPVNLPEPRGGGFNQGRGRVGFTGGRGRFGGGGRGMHQNLQCYECGALGHIGRNCEMRRQRLATNNFGYRQQQYQAPPVYQHQYQAPPGYVVRQYQQMRPAMAQQQAPMVNQVEAEAAPAGEAQYFEPARDQQ